MPNQDQQRNQGQHKSDRDRESNLGQAGSDMHRPAGTSGQQSERAGERERGSQQNEDEEDSAIAARTASETRGA
jgi:hypothetical protein